MLTEAPCVINALPQPLVLSTCDGRMCINHNTLALRACSKYILWKRPGEGGIAATCPCCKMMGRQAA